MKSKIIIGIVAAVAVLGGGYTVSRMDLIGTGKVGIVYNYKDGVQDKVLIPGMHFIAPMNKVKEFSTTDSAIVSTVTSSAEWTKKADTNTVQKLETRVEQTETDITSKVSKGSISSEINQTAQGVKISASKIDFNGLVTANKYFKINKNGSMEAISGKIGGWKIDSLSLIHI